jgi:hypothetical protein
MKRNRTNSWDEISFTGIKLVSIVPNIGESKVVKLSMRLVYNNN